MKRRLLEKLKKSGRTSPRELLGKKPVRLDPPNKQEAKPIVNYVPLIVVTAYIQSREYAPRPSSPTAEDIRWVIGQELLRLFVNGRNPENEKNIDALTTRIWDGQNDYSGTASAYTIHFDSTRDRRFDISRAQPWIYARTNN